MNDGMYTNLRNYLEEIASTNKQIMSELKRTNELLAGQQKKPAEKSIDSDGFVMGKAVNVPKEAVGPVTVETVEVVDQHGKEHKPIGDTGIYHVPPGTDLKQKAKPDAHLAAVTQKPATKTAKKGK